jgi:hypothetical protein
VRVLGFGSDSQRSGSGSPDDVTMAECGESDGAGVADGEEHGHRRHQPSVDDIVKAAKASRHH